MSNADIGARLRNSTILRYGLPVFSVAISLAATFLLQPYVFRTPFFFLSILLSTWFAGVGPGLLAVFLSTLSIYFILNTAGTSSIRFYDVSNLATFILSALLVGSWSAARKRTEEALRESERRFRTFVDHAMDAFFMHDERGVILDVNRFACESLGYTRDELIGMTAIDFDPDVTPAEHEELLRQLNDPAKTIAFESRHRRKDGTIFPVEIRGQSYWEGGRRFAVSLARDISARKDAEQALQQAHDELELKVAERTAELRRATAELETILDASPVGIALLGTGRAIQRCNPAFERIVGWKVDELKGRPVSVLKAHDEQLGAFIEGLDGSEEITNVEIRLVRKDGSEFDAAVSWAPLQAEAGSPGGYVATVQDISDRKRTEEALRRSEAYLAEAQRLSHTGSWSWNPGTGKLIHWSEEQSRLFGFDPDDGIPSVEEQARRFHPEDHDRVLETFDRAVRERTDFAVDLRVVLPDSIIKYLHEVGRPVFNSSGELVEYIGTTMDVTERKQAEEERERLLAREQTARAEAIAAQQQFADLVNSVEGVVWEADASTFVFSFVSEQAHRILGYPTERWLSEPTFWKDHLHPDDRDRVINLSVIATAEKRNHDFEYRMIAADGRIVWLRDIVTVVVEGGRATKLRGLLVDMTARRLAEQSLREQADLLNLTHDTVFVRDRNDIIKYWNRGAQELYGWTEREAVGQMSHQLMQTIFPKPLEEINAELLATGRWEGELIHTKRDGTQVVVASRWSLERDDAANAVAVLETNNDVTERKHAEEALQKAQAELAHVTRVTTMGELTSSIAHEVNQPLTAIVANGNACLRWLAVDPPNLVEARETVGRIIKEGHRAGEVITRIRSLVRKSSPARASLDLNDTIREVLAIIDPEARRQRVVVQIELAADLPAVQGDRVQLQQVLLNLSINAIEAMSAVTDRPRKLLIRSQRNEPDGVLVAVQDTGVGLEAQSFAQLFNAFYTTKADGMGMGLSISRSIIEAHGGKLWATSTNGQGATFKFTLQANAMQK